MMYHITQLDGQTHEIEAESFHVEPLYTVFTNGETPVACIREVDTVIAEQALAKPEEKP